MEMIHSIWKSLRMNRTAMVGFVVVFAIVLIALLAPIISPYNPEALFVGPKLRPPSLEFLLGTDELGRDVLSRIFWGARISIYVGLTASLLSAAIGILIGAISGYSSGYIDSTLMRLTDILLTLPTLILIITAVSMFETRGLEAIIIIMGFLGWPSLARIVRAEFLSLKERQFVEASRIMGASKFSMIFRHILPNTMASIIVIATISIATFVLTEASLTFLGLGDPTRISWGMMLNAGMKTLRIAPWIATFPGLALFITTLGFNLLGDGIRDALDVRARMFKK